MPGSAPFFSLFRVLPVDRRRTSKIPYRGYGKLNFSDYSYYRSFLVSDGNGLSVRPRRSNPRKRRLTKLMRTSGNFLPFLRLAFLAAWAVGLMSLVSPARAQTFTWDGGGNAGNLNWSLIQSWNPNTAPADNATAAFVFAGTTKLSNNNDLTGLTFTTRSPSIRGQVRLSSAATL